MSLLRFVWISYIGLYLAFTTILSAQNEYKYSYMPKKVYKNQLFPVTLVGPDDSPSLTFDTSSTIQPLFYKPLLVKNGNDTFYTFYFKAKNIDVRIPRLFIRSNTIQSSLENKTVILEVLKHNKTFSGVLAADMKIKNHQVSNYDGKNHIVTLSIEAYEANIEDMHLNTTSEFGVEEIRRANAKVTAEFFAVLPLTQEFLSFSYFNTIKKKYITLSVPVKVSNSSVTTQSDLNPKVDAFNQLKRYALIMFSLFFFIIFLWKRDFFYLILGVISLITLLTFYIPHKKICVKQGSPLYVIPTDTSTISTRISSKLDTMILGEHGAYKKVEYKRGIIGWIKNEDICNN